MTSRLEWWPDHCGILLADESGANVPLASLGLDADLLARLLAWVGDYAENKLPIDGPGDPLWLDTGVQLLAETRGQLAGRYDVIVTEPWWDEPPADAARADLQRPPLVPICERPSE